MQRAGNILKKFASDYGLEPGLTLLSVRKQWKSIVGATIAAHCFPDGIQGTTLIVVVDTPQWMHHLSFYRHDIQQRLKPFGAGEVRFRVGKLPEKAQPQREQGASSLTGESQEFIEETLKPVKDEELRSRFRTLLIHSFSAGPGRRDDREKSA
jgi:hypothetical protein